MAAPELIDWKVFLSEYVIVVAVYWLHALLNDFRMHRISPSLVKTLEEMTDEASEAFSGIRSVEYLRFLSCIHNRIEWCSIHPVHIVMCKGVLYATSVYVDIHSALLYLYP